MKRLFNYIGLSMLSAMTLVSCSDKFLDEKINYDSVGLDVYNNFDGANARLSDIYQLCLPSGYSEIAWNNPSTGTPDLASKSTEEYCGFSNFVNPQTPMTTDNSGNRVPSFFDNENKVRSNIYGSIRNINDVIEGVSGGTLSSAEKDRILGQAYFFRAWCYYNLVRWYGGVPIVAEVQEPKADAVTPRSTAKECIDFILADLEMSAKLLADYTMNGTGWDSNNWGRVTTGTALALKGRVLLLWASPLFNRSNDPERWTSAYKQMADDLSSITACGYHLYQTTENVNGSDFAKLFTVNGINPEAVFVTLYNNQVGEGTDTQKNNLWERYIRPLNTTGRSGLEASAMLVDMFPMSDGRVPAEVKEAGFYTKLKASEILNIDEDNPTASYLKMYPFVDRDPRFYRTFAFPGVRWAFNGDASRKDPHYTSNGTQYSLWNYVWYANATDKEDMEGTSYGADYLGSDPCGIYVRKRSDDYDVNKQQLYSYDATHAYSGFTNSAAPYLELRFAEVLLNLAEVACGANDISGALGYLNQVRRRAGVPDITTADFEGEAQAACMSAILYERQVEFAYEGKRFEDCRRWMLYDGGAVKVPGAPDSWTLTGWGGNTCTWLGFKPLNGQRRDKMQFYVTSGYGGLDEDPCTSSRCAPLDYQTDNLSEQTAVLQNWYKNNLKRKRVKGDARDQNKVELYMDFHPEYYIIGLCSRAQAENKQLPQTIGWEDMNNPGSKGTFDPLEE